MLTDCTVAANFAATVGGLFNLLNATLLDCTLSGNSGAKAGGMYNFGYATLTACTVAANYASSGSGGLNNANMATLADTIIAGNTTINGTASDIGGGGARDVTGTFNLIGTGGSGGINNGSNGNVVLTPALGQSNSVFSAANPAGLAPLGDYGGPTQTMALLPGSPAIGKGTGADAPITDQRGFALDSPTPDIGAFQTNPLVVNTTIDGVGSPLGDLSLRQAVNLANALNAAETITFDPTVFATAQTSP